MDPKTLTERMSGLARDLRAQGSGEETLRYVVESAVDLIEPCEDAGITLASRGGGIRTSAATSERPTRNDHLQQEANAGPCLDAVWKERVVSVPDLTREDRWPQWASRAHAELGIGSVVCFQLFTHQARVGALNVFSSVPRAFTTEDIDIGLAIAAHAAVAVAAAEDIDNLQLAMDSRTVIGQACGMVMERYGLTSDAAFAVLRRLSMEQNQKLVKVAHQFVGLHNDQAASP